jgi:hypothetical protein
MKLACEFLTPRLWHAKPGPLSGGNELCGAWFGSGWMRMLGSLDGLGYRIHVDENGKIVFIFNSKIFVFCYQ